MISSSASGLYCANLIKDPENALGVSRCVMTDVFVLQVLQRQRVVLLMVGCQMRFVDIYLDAHLKVMAQRDLGICNGVDKLSSHPGFRGVS